jgi:hypothetical protein
LPRQLLKASLQMQVNCKDRIVSLCTARPVMDPYKAITELAGRVEDEFSKTDGGAEFLPYNKLSEFVTRDEVASAFQIANFSGWEGLVDFVLNDAKRLFLILVMMTSKGEEKLSLLKGLERDGIKDASLPIDFNKRENKQYYGYSLEGRHDGPQFGIFDEWERNERVLFRSTQWQFTAPVFGEGRFRFHFAADVRLPFLKVAAKPSSTGFFGEVSRIEIHPKHIPILKAVCNLPLLFSTQLNSDLLGSSHRNSCHCCQKSQRYRRACQILR